METETLCDGCEYDALVTGDVDQNGNTSVYGFQGGEEIYRVEVDQHLTEAELQAGFDVSAEVSALTCLNNLGSNISCEDAGDPTPDTMTLGLTVSDGGATFENSISYSVANPPSAGFQNYSIQLTVPENQLSLSETYAAFRISAIDEGFWAGNYGPAVRDPSMAFQYTETPEAVDQGSDLVTQRVLDSARSELSVADVPDFMDTETADQSASQDQPEVTAIEEPEVDAEPEIQDIEAETEDTDQISVPFNLASAGAEASESAARMAAMAESAADVGSYRAVSYPDRQFYEPRELDGGETWDNPAVRAWATGADRRMESMVDMQWSD